MNWPQQNVLQLNGILQITCEACGHVNRLERRRFSRGESVHIVCHNCEGVLRANQRRFERFLTEAEARA